ncbi:MAG: hypothetical protein LBR22_04955 [Desulfovibrio sp.]|nr:hypothetical protein [Desulfovibrio sp.]
MKTVKPVRVEADASLGIRERVRLVGGGGHDLGRELPACLDVTLDGPFRLAGDGGGGLGKGGGGKTTFCRFATRILVAVISTSFRLRMQPLVEVVEPGERGGDQTTFCRLIATALFPLPP